MNNFTSYKGFLKIITLFVILSFGNLAAQTPGMIYEPATGLGAAVLDPNGDGYVSLTTNGFTTDDQLQSEIAYSSLIFPMVEPNSDLGPGPDCGFTDFVDQGDQDPVQSYLDASNNWLFRMRMGKTAPNAKSYSVLIDTDGKFGGTGPNADPQYSSSNPGFEIEIVLSTKFGVFVYDVNNMNCTPVISYAGTTNYQKSIALTTSCGDPDYFYDFFLKFSDLTTQFGITPATKMRMAIVDNMAANKSTLCNSSSASDLAGIDDASCGSILENCFADIVDNYTPCAPGVICPDRSVCPGINSINTGATSISGTSTEADGTIIDVYKNGVFIGSTTVSSGIWTLSSISPALVTNNVITATATAPSKGVSIANCNAVTVVSCSSVTTVPAAGDIVKISGSKGYDLTVSRPIGTIVRCYNANGVLIDPVALALEAPNNLNTVTTTSVGQHVLFKCQTGNCFGNALYIFTYQEPGKCESSRTYDCQYSSVTATANPTLITTPISTSTTSVSGSMNAPDNVSGVTVNLMSSGIQLGTTTTTAGGAWTIGSLSLSSRECQTLSVVAIISGKCISTGSVTAVIQRKGITPVINGPICTNAAVTSVSGTSVEAAGTIIQVFENGIAEGSTTTVLANGTWTASTGINIALGSTITAKASGSCLSLSDASNSVFVGTKSSNAVTITSSPIYECAASVSGTGTNGDVVSLYIDGFQIGGTTTVSGGIWTIGSLDAYCYLYADGVVTAKAATGANCEGNASAGVTVLCVNPLDNLTVTPASKLICSGSTVAVTVQGSESGIIYQLFNGTTASGTSKLGTGGNIVLTSSALSSATTLTVKAIRLGNTCTVTLLNSVAVTIDVVPTTPATTVTQPTCATATGTITVTVQTAGETYSFDNGSSFQATNIKSGLATGSYDVIVKSTGGCNSSATATTINGQPATPAAPSAGAVTQPTCSVATGSFQIASYSAANTYTFTPSVVGISGTGLVTANAGSYTFTVTNASGCTSSASSSVVVNAQPATPAAPSAGAVTQPTCSVATGSFQIASYSATNTYTFTPSVVGISGTGLVTANAGSYTFTDTNASGCTSSASSSIVVNVQPATPAAPSAGAVTQPTCSTATGTITVTVQTAGETYSFDNGNSFQASNIKSGLATGSYDVIIKSAGGCNSAATTTAINAQPNCTPLAVNDTPSDVIEDSGLTNILVLGNDSFGNDGPNVGSISVTAIATAIGAAILNNGGTANNPTDDTIDFTPALNYNGIVTINYTITDSNGDTSSATVTITVNAVNDAPIANNDTATTLSDINVTIAVSSNDVDIDGTINPATIDLNASLSGQQITLTVAGEGTYTANANGSVTFDPLPTFSGTSTPVNYTIQDNLGSVSNTATITVTVGPCVNNPVLDCDNDGLTNAQEVTLGTNPLNLDTDGDGVLDGKEVSDGTNPLDQCSFKFTSMAVVPSASWSTADCDNDGLKNGQEITIGTNPLNPDTDGDGVLDGKEVSDGTKPLDPCDSIEEHVTVPQSVLFINGDCDGDGLLNGEEIGADPTHPFDSNGNGIPDYLEFNNHDLSNSEDDVEVFNGVSPSSDDAKNNVLTIRNIEKYPNNTLEIYNRWGVLVYEASGYGQGNKFFKGESEGRVTISIAQQLPEETYFYVLKYVKSDGTVKERTGYLYINR